MDTAEWPRVFGSSRAPFTRTPLTHRRLQTTGGGKLGKLGKLGMLAVFGAGELAGCMEAPSVDLEGPQVVVAPLGGRPRVEVPTFVALDVQLSEPMSASSGEGVALVAWELAGPCSADLLCDDGLCIAGQCQVDPVSSRTWRALEPRDEYDDTEDADIEGRVDIDIEWLDHAALGPHSRLRVRPARALAPKRRHSLLLGEGVRDQAGAMLVDEAGLSTVARWEFVTAGEGSGGPEARLVSPPPGHEQVDPATSTLAFGLRRPVEVDPEDVVWLIDERGERVRIVDLEPCVGWVAGYCVAGHPSPALTGETWYRVEGTSLKDRHDRRGVPPHEVEWFRTGAAGSGETVDLDGLEVQLHGPCAHVAGLVGQGAAAEAKLVGGETRHLGPLELASALDVGLRGPGVYVGEVSGPHAVEVSIVDWRGDEHWRGFEVVRPARRAQVSISEVLANASGKESAGEFVELEVSATSGPVSTQGWYVADLEFEEVVAAVSSGEDPPGDELPAVVLAPGSVALIVGSGFDPSTFPEASMPNPSAVRLTTSGTIASGGLRNEGEPISVYTVDPLMLIASYGDFIDTSSSALDGVSVSARAGEVCDVPARWMLTTGGATPGWIP